MKRLLLLGSLMLAGCTTQLGQFTLYSPDPLDLSKGEYVVDRSEKLKAVEGSPIYVVYAPEMPQYDTVVRKAIAQRPGCVGLAEVTLTRRAFWLLFGFCDFEAEGYPIVPKGGK